MNQYSRFKALVKYRHKAIRRHLNGLDELARELHSEGKVEEATIISQAIELIVCELWRVGNFNPRKDGGRKAA